MHSSRLWAIDEFLSFSVFLLQDGAARGPNSAELLQGKMPESQRDPWRLLSLWTVTWLFDAGYCRCCLFGFVFLALGGRVVQWGRITSVCMLVYKRR